MSWGMIGAATISAVAGSQRQGAANAAADRLAERTKFTPFNITSSVGTTKSDGNNLSYQLSPQLQGIQSNLFGIGANAFNAYQGFDPNQAAADAYKRLNVFAAPQEAQARTGLENRLFAQGRLGTTGGAQQYGQLVQQQNLTDLARQQASIELGQRLQSGILSQGLTALGGGMTLDQAMMNKLQMGGNFGIAQSNAVKQGAQAQFDVDMSNAATTNDFWNQIAGGMGGLFGSGGGMTFNQGYGAAGGYVQAPGGSANQLFMGTGGPADMNNIFRSWGMGG